MRKMNQNMSKYSSDPEIKIEQILTKYHEIHEKYVHIKEENMELKNNL